MARFLQNWLGATVTCVLLSGAAEIYAAKIPPVPENPRWAQTSLGFNAKSRCPDLRMADEGTIAVLVFWLPSSGIPSQVSIKSSSGLSALDSAALSCVSRLRFAPASTLGTGEPIDSWQQAGFRWAEGHVDRPPVTTAQTLPSATPSASVPVAAPSTPVVPDAPVASVAAVTSVAPVAPSNSQDRSSRPADSVTVHVCADETGRLAQDPTIVHSSGVTALDQAAVKIAASGSTYYRPDTSSNGPPLSGCAQITIKFDTK